MRKIYKRVMNQLVVSDELRNKVLASAADAADRRTAHPAAGWVRPVCGAAACAAAAFMIPAWIYFHPAGAVPYERSVRPEDNISPAAETGAQCVNPITAYETLPEALDALPFSPAVLPGLPENFSVSVISGDLFQLEWKSGPADFTFRAAEGSGDISGDWNEYPAEVSSDISGMNVVFCGEEDAFSLALWQTGGQSFSLSASPAVPQEMLSAVIEEAVG